MTTAQRSDAPSKLPTAPTRQPCPEADAALGELQRLTADISARLRRVCGHLSDDEFAELVLEIVRVRVQYEPRSFAMPRVPRKHDD